MPALLERPKMTRTMYQALKRHIIKERDRKKQEQEEGARLERIRKETAIRKKHEEEASLTLEQTKEQIVSLETKLASLKQEKHELFNQLKKVLQQEEDARQKATLREQSELMSLQQPYTHTLPSHHPMLLQTVTGRPALYKPTHPALPPAPVQKVSTSGIKRARSPSPPTQPLYAVYETNYPSTVYPSNKTGTPQPVRHDYKSYQPTKGGHVAYGNQSGQTYIPVTQAGYTGQSPARKFTQANPSAFTSYPTHYPQHASVIAEVPHGYQLRVAQPPYIAGRLVKPATPQKSGYPEEPYSLQQHPHSLQPSSLPRQQSGLLASSTQQQSKSGSNYTGSRGQAPPTSTSSRGHYSNTQPSSRYY